MRLLHRAPEFVGALFQVASQFNLLEMTSPSISPEVGVTGYMHDATQGPACAIAAGAATIYRNYFVPVDGGEGQTSDRQLDGLQHVRHSLAKRLGRELGDLWRMQNGYVQPSRESLATINELLGCASADELDALRADLAIGVHADVQVTDVKHARVTVSQAFCSALPISYCKFPTDDWRRFAQLVLDAAYEATLLAAVEQAQRGGSPTVLLTHLGGGAFGNPTDWIQSAMRRALRNVEHAGLDVRIVCFSRVDAATQELLDEFGR